MRDARYGTYRWRQLSGSIRRRDMNLCQVRLPNCTVVATCVDHRIEPGPPELRRNDLFFDPSNLRACCASCNTAKRNTRRNLLARQAEMQTPPSRDW
jgi:hypothetical protein